MGADEGILLNDPSFEEIDNFQTAAILAETIKKVGIPNLVLMGRAAADWDMGVVPIGVAQFLDIPCVTVAKAMELNDSTLTVERVLDDGFETVETSLPAVVSVSNEFGEPRYPQLRQIMLAAKKNVDVWNKESLGIASEIVGSENRLLPLEALYVPKVESNVEIVEGDSPEEKARNLALKLREAKLI